MRMFLESSKKKYLSLGEELKLLRLYVELEMLRFEGRMSVEWDVDPVLDQYNIEVPSVLIQPFVENAIHHGLFNKKGAGLLRLYFHQTSEENLRCIIEDNGIGRDMALQLRRQSLHQFQSRSMQIVQERLEVLGAMTDYRIGIHIEDLQDQQGAAAGTRVVLDLPIKVSLLSA